jgi:glycosyltransferase involved in cell wall biosynthesis
MINHAEPLESVSVILPYYNRADTLSQAAISVLSQTHTELLLYLINDGSTDGSRAVARALNDSRVIHIDLQRRLGVARARNVGLREATTSLVSFMDSDDVWLPSKIATQLEFLHFTRRAGQRVAVLGCGWSILPSNTPAKEFFPGPYSRIDVLHNRVSGLRTPMLLIDRRVSAECALFDQSLPALLDRDYVASCLENGTYVMIVPQVLSLVRRGRDDHVATSRRAATAFEMLAEKYAADLVPRPRLRSWYSYRAAREHLIHRDIRKALPHFRNALRDRRAQRLVHLSFGLLGARRGFALAQRLLTSD